jgi:hypothetical protein
VYFFTIYTSALWLRTSETSDTNQQIIPYLSFTCLFLFLKLISFLNVTRFYGIYYVIIIKVAKQLWFFFICIIMMILFSFAIAFYILLSPKSSYSLDERIVNDDPNNPWNLSPSYQLFENGTSDGLNNNLFILQKPDENTNMFSILTTSFFATFLLITGIPNLLFAYKKKSIH